MAEKELKLKDWKVYGGDRIAGVVIKDNNKKEFVSGEIFRLSDRYVELGELVPLKRYRF